MQGKMTAVLSWEFHEIYKYWNGMCYSVATEKIANNDKTQ